MIKVMMALLMTVLSMKMLATTVAMVVTCVIMI